MIHIHYGLHSIPCQDLYMGSRDLNTSPNACLAGSYALSHFLSCKMVFDSVKLVKKE